MANSFFEKDTGYNKFMTQFEVSAGETAVFVGLLRSSGQYKNKGQRGKGVKAKPITLAQLAAVMIYGTEDGHIPPRDFMTMAIRDNKDKIQKILRQIALRVLEGKTTKKTGMAVLGQSVVDMMKRAINSGKFRANARSTIRRKGSSKPLIDTGQLKNAIDFEVKEGKK